MSASPTSAAPTAKREPAARSAASRQSAQQNESTRAANPGNLQLQGLLSSGMLRPKLAIGAPDDPAEAHADQVARSVMSGDAPCSCSAGGGSCPKCQAQSASTAIRRKAADSGASAAAIGNLQLGSGRKLGDAERGFFEHRMDMDLSAVQVHDNDKAADAAEQMKARAFTVGTNIAFAEGAYQPHTNSGRELIAHELAHVMQNSSTIRRSPVVGPHLDPRNTGAWGFYESEAHRKAFWFLNTVQSAGESAKDLEAEMANAPKPATDDERDAFDEKVETLIRLRAIAMVGKHRDELLQRQQQFEAMVADPQPAAPNGDAGAANPKREDFLRAVRASAQTVNRLRTEKDSLEELRDKAMRTVIVNGGPESLPDEWADLRDCAFRHSTPNMFYRVMSLRAVLPRRDRGWAWKKDVLMMLAREIRDLRNKQMRGIDASIALTYNAFPFLSDLSAEWIEEGKRNDPYKVPKVLGLGMGLVGGIGGGTSALWLARDLFQQEKPPDNNSLLAEIRASYEKLLNKTDDSIVEIGTGDIHPFDLPGAVAAVRATLPEELRGELDQLIEYREAKKFAIDMVLALGLAVLTGLTGGLAGIGLAGYAAAAGGVAATAGIIQTAVQFEDMFDKQTLADAATNPEKNLLGVSAPSMFEWTMAGVSLVLSVADLAAVAKEITSVHPPFSEKPKLPDAHNEPNIAGELHSAEPTGVPHIGEPIPETPSAAPKPLAAESAAEKRVIDAGVGDAVPTMEQVEAELAIVEEAKPKKIPGKEFKEEVELENGHTWRHKADDTWCRFSDKRVCVPGAKGKARTKVSSLEDVDKVEAASRPRLDSPPASVVTNEDLTMWELYAYYYDERLANIRLDLTETQATKRGLPRTYEDFRDTWKDSKALAALKGRVAQARLGGIVDQVVHEGKVGQNIAISAVEKPGPKEIVRPDLLWQRSGGGFTGVSTKARDLRNVGEAQLKKIVYEDVDEVLGKYHGQKWVRTPGTEVSSRQIDIDEVFLNYDPRKIPDDVRPRMTAYALEYAEGRGHIEITFAEVDNFENFIP